MRGVCFYACACSARRENAGTLVRSAFRQEQSLSRSFSLRGGGLRRFSFCKAICTTPRKLCGVFVFMPAPALRVVKMRGHSFAPRSVRNSRSLVHFHSAGAACAAFLFARQFVQHPANNAGCLFLCLTDLGSVEPPPSLRAFLPRDGKTQTRPARQSELCRLSYAWLFLLPHKKIKDFLAGTPFTSPKMRDLRYIPIESLFLALT